jgi:DNA-binding transcriptional ArsR family regulator
MPTLLAPLEAESPACCTPLGLAGTLTTSEASDFAARLKALADPIRLRLVAYLLAQPDHEACTCDLAPVVGLTEPTVSHHLKRLEASGMVSKERHGMKVHYRVSPEAIHAIARVLSVGCC